LSSSKYTRAETGLVAADPDILIKASNENTSILNKKINAIVKEFNTWFHANDLLKNTKKTVTILFCVRQCRSFLKASN